MAERTLRTRIALLYKTLEQWNTNPEYVPLKGEVCICEVPAESGVVVSEPAVLFKVGNGTSKFVDLPWASALAADVYAWAKKENLEFEDLTDDFKAKIKELVGGDELDTLYELVTKEDEDGRVIGYQLMKSEDKGATFVEATGYIDLENILDSIEALDDELAGVESDIEDLAKAHAELEAKVAADKAEADAKIEAFQPISEDMIRELFLEPVSVPAGKTVAEVLANLGEDDKLMLNPTDNISEDLIINDGAFIDAQGATLSGNIKVAEGAVIKNAVFTGKVTIE